MRRPFSALTIALFVALLLSGCSKPGPEPDPVPEPSRTDGPGTEGSSSTEPSETTSPPLPGPPKMIWNDCHGMGGLFTEPAPAAPTGSEVPPGWEQPIDTISSYQLIVFRCGRVSIGPYERPVTGMTEAHNKITVPQQCIDFNSDLNDIYVLAALWIDDAEIAAHLRTHYGMPVRVATFNYEDESVSSGQRSWTWATESFPASEMNLPFVDGTGNAAEWTSRLVWHNGTGVSVWDKKESSVGDNLPQALGVYGVLHEPMLHARMDGEPVAGRGGTFIGDLSGAIYRFGDLECKKPQ